MTARPNLPETSLSAYRASDELRVRQKSLVYDALRFMPNGGTCDEIATACGLTSVQVNRLVAVMERAGLIETTGATRPGATGRQMRVWRIATKRIFHSASGRVA